MDICAAVAPDTARSSTGVHCVQDPIVRRIEEEGRRGAACFVFLVCCYATAAKAREPIQVTLPDGAVKVATSWETSPMDIAKSLSKSLPDKLVIAKVDGELWDLERPLEKSCNLELLTFDHDQGISFVVHVVCQVEQFTGKEVFWHSSAHVLGEACERHYGCHLCLGPPIEEGFYYEMDIDGRNVEAADYAPLETIAKSVIKEKQQFERLVISKENLLKMFKVNGWNSVRTRRT
ncbi:MAG: Threonyl/alanyl tRNA synthetase [Olpidium bornovanus]|uniref:threonine--tRNA ligase n=1 Tax=Olpidium bornovanus TaxID=278681 RepID=A0A8H7ZR58_9FUNG|nr:MAG: Threonyl/alanyl tRNA synthetase [Olpidium bornovanus]